MDEIEKTIFEVHDDFIGMLSVKRSVARLATFVMVALLRGDLGSLGLHMSFTGGPGTGKTSIAKRIAALLMVMGFLEKGHLVEASRVDLVGQYVGHTAPKTREVVESAMGGVLFIDGADTLFRGSSSRDFGSEVIEILLQFMENRRGDFVVVLAGPSCGMESFFKSNPGLSSRVQHHIHFPDYTPRELVEMIDLWGGDYNLKLAGVSASLVGSWIALQSFFSRLYQR
jgi:AAA+ superfamily predicted ATPase